jgi:enoyl-CoA hydratase/3-hydroxyacyl-CoA dehydrogenase
MRAVEVVEGELTSPETAQVAASFAQGLRKAVVRCGDAPGFVIDRLLLAALSEAWAIHEQTGVSGAAIDAAITGAKLLPVGPFQLGDVLGAGTIKELGEQLHVTFGDRFHFHEGSPAGGDLADDQAAALAERMTLRLIVEACLVLEEGVTAMKDVDLAAAAGAGISPGPLARADRIGLDQVLESLERAVDEWGEQFEPPTIIRRLVNQGRLGASTGQGFFAYPRPDAGWEDGPLKLETRDAVAIAWLDRPPANSLSPELVASLRRAWDAVVHAGTIRALVFASANPSLFCAGADIKAFTQLDRAGAAGLVGDMHALLREFECSRIVTIAAVGGLALGGGCELAMGCDFRIASESASFGQPEIGLGIIPGFGGTQRLPRLVGTSKALEMNLTGDPIGAEEAYEIGLANRLVPDHELLDTALAWARKLSGQAPLAIQAIKRVSGAGELDEGLGQEQEAFVETFVSADGREGVAAFIEKRPPVFRGE